MRAPAGSDSVYSRPAIAATAMGAGQKQGSRLDWHSSPLHNTPMKLLQLQAAHKQPKKPTVRDSLHIVQQLAVAFFRNQAGHRAWEPALLCFKVLPAGKKTASGGELGPVQPPGARSLQPSATSHSPPLWPQLETSSDHLLNYCSATRLQPTFSMRHPTKPCGTSASTFWAGTSTGKLCPAFSSSSV